MMHRDLGNWMVRKAATSQVNSRILKAVGQKPISISSTLEGQRKQLLDRFKIATVLDVGGHVGAYAGELRKEGFSGRIISFEPDPRAFATLRLESEHDPEWQSVQIGLGSQKDVMNLRLANVEGGMTSLLPLAEEGAALFPQDTSAPTHPVEIVTLDSWIKDQAENLPAPVMLKIDTQGYELEILKGALETLKITQVIEIELPLRIVYEGAGSFSEIQFLLKSHGFHLVAVHTARWLEGFAVDCDCLFSTS